MLFKELNDFIDRRADEFQREIKAMTDRACRSLGRTEFERRSLGQKLRFARGRIQRKDNEK